MITATIRECGSGLNCPALHWQEGGRVIASGPNVTDPEVLRDLALPADESAVELTESLLAKVGTTRIDNDGLSEYVDKHHTRDLFRLETLSSYAVDSDGDDYRRYLRGEPAPTADSKEPWLNRLRTDIAAGRLWRRVHAVTLPLSDYLRFECEWAYTDNVAAGEDVRIFGDATDALLSVGDFFVLDGEHVLRSVYDEEGHFIGADVLHDATAKAPYIAIRDLVWRTSDPFSDWWQRHPEFHRSCRAA